MVLLLRLKDCIALNFFPFKLGTANLDFSNMIFFLSEVYMQRYWKLWTPQYMVVLIQS
jgi:hypothetical protein